MILIERKLLAVAQRRIGPVMLGKRGILQIVADVVKPLFKEIFEQKIQTISMLSLNVLFLLFTQLVFSLLFTICPAMALYSFFDFVTFLQGCFTVLTGVAVLYLGMLSGTRYAVLGALRLIISEISTGLITFIVQLLVFEAASSTSLTLLFLFQGNFAAYQLFGQLFSLVQLFQTFVSAQRSPLDLIEVEGELVAGYNTEFSGADVLIIYFAEYFHLFNGALQFVIFTFGAFGTPLLLTNILFLFL